MSNMFTRKLTLALHRGHVVDNTHHEVYVHKSALGVHSDDNAKRFWLCRRLLNGLGYQLGRATLNGGEFLECCRF